MGRVRVAGKDGSDPAATRVLSPLSLSCRCEASDLSRSSASGPISPGFPSSRHSAELNMICARTIFCPDTCAHMTKWCYQPGIEEKPAVPGNLLEITEVGCTLLVDVTQNYPAQGFASPPLCAPDLACALLAGTQ